MEAFDSLSEMDRLFILRFMPKGSEDVLSALEALLEEAQNKRKICEANQWIFHIGNHTVRLRDTANKVILWIDKFKRIGDIAAGVDPIRAGLPWAAVRFLLQVLSVITFCIV